MNWSEEIVRDLLAKSGEVLSSGWPDLLVRDASGGVYAVEVKGPGDSVRGNQAEVHEWLVQAGVRVFIAHVDEDCNAELVHATEPGAHVPADLREMQILEDELERKRKEHRARQREERLKRAAELDARALHVRGLLTDGWQTASEIAQQVSSPLFPMPANNDSWARELMGAPYKASPLQRLTLSVAAALKPLCAIGDAEKDWRDNTTYYRIARARKAA